MRIVLILMVFVIVVATPCFGQQGKPTPGTIVTINEPPSSYRKVGKAEISYFAGSDTTEVRTEWPAHQSETLSASMWFEFRTKGKSVKRPQSVDVNLGCSGRKEMLQEITTFEFDADGHEITIDRPLPGGVEYDLNAKKFLRAIHGSVTFDTFEKLVSSSSLKVHVGKTVFELDKNSRSALRDMLKAVQE